MFTALNLLRPIKIIDKNVFKKFLRELASLFVVIMTSLKPFSAPTKLHGLSLTSFQTKKRLSYRLKNINHFSLDLELNFSF